MKFEQKLDEHTSARHLSLYEDIERQIIPRSNDTAIPSISQQFYAESKKTNTWLIASTVLITALVSTGLFLQYAPVAQLEPYRLTALASRAKSVAIEQANALSDIMTYDKCVEKGGVIIADTSDQYCVLDSVKYAQPSNINQSAEVQESHHQPLGYQGMNTYRVGIEGQKLAVGDVVYTGYATSLSQYPVKMTVRSIASINDEQTTMLDSVFTGSVLTPDILNIMSLSQKSAELSQVLDTVEVPVITDYYDVVDPSATRVVLEGPVGAWKSMSIIALLKSTTSIISLESVLPQSFLEIVNTQYNVSCATSAPEDVIACLRNTVLSDKSMKEKIQKDTNDLIRYFATKA